MLREHCNFPKQSKANHRACASGVEPRGAWSKRGATLLARSLARSATSYSVSTPSTSSTSSSTVFPVFLSVKIKRPELVSSEEISKHQEGDISYKHLVYKRKK